MFVQSLVRTIIPLRTYGVRGGVSVTFIDASPSRRYHIIPNCASMPSHNAQYCGTAFGGRQARIG